ncbi:MAG TPA: amino acid ABC transporter permease [Actinomycetota bacterium]|nr:amino acid ABC transporter permease [Actinomycetota bacterium]
MVAVRLADELGPRARKRVTLISILAAAVFGFVIFLAIRRFAQEGELDAEKWTTLTDPQVLRFFGTGLVNTLRAAAVALVGACLLGTLLALGRLSKLVVVRMVARSYIEFFRGFPLILLMLFSFFTLPTLGIELSRFGAVAAALTAYNGAVLGEIFRAGILSLDRGQTEAAQAIGLRRSQAMRLVILPQAYRRMTPTIVSQFVTLLKDTSLASVVAYEELLHSGEIAGEFFQNLLQSLVFVAAIYLVVNFTLSQIARRFELRQRRRYRASPIETAGPEDLVVVGLDPGAPGRGGTGR